MDVRHTVNLHNHVGLPNFSPYTLLVLLDSAKPTQEGSSILFCCRTRKASGGSIWNKSKSKCNAPRKKILAPSGTQKSALPAASVCENRKYMQEEAKNPSDGTENQIQAVAQPTKSESGTQSTQEVTHNFRDQTNNQEGFQQVLGLRRSGESITLYSTIYIYPCQDDPASSLTHISYLFQRASMCHQPNVLKEHQWIWFQKSRKVCDSFTAELGAQTLVED